MSRIMLGLFAVIAAMLGAVAAVFAVEAGGAWAVAAFTNNHWATNLLMGGVKGPRFRARRVKQR